MTLKDITWDELKPFLVSDCKQADGSMTANKSKFKVLSNWFADKDFNRKEFNIFIYEFKKTGYSNSYLNNFIKLAKHIARYLEISDQFKDYSYFNEESPLEEPLTPKEITKLAEVSIRYHRFKNRKEKHKALIHFLGNVGSRIDESLKLEWSDLVTTPFCMVHFRAQITKTKKERFCPIPHWLYEILWSLPRENQFVFSKIDAANFRRDLKLRAEKCNIKKDVHPHLFRDSSINNKLYFGMPLELVTAYHGHSTTNTTYKYYVRIKTKQLAQSLYNIDPAFKDDQNFENVSEACKQGIEKVINPRVCEYNYQSILNDNNKREVIIKLVER